MTELSHQRDRQGREISVFEWGELHHDDAYRVIGCEEFEHCTVSTVWVGLLIAWDHTLPDTYGLFETMVFGGIHDQYIQKYATEEEAYLGHVMLCLCELMEYV